mgnify:CR=1 FL=1
MYPRSSPTAGKKLEFCQPGKDLPTNVDQFIQPLPQVLHVGSVDFAAFVGTFGVLVQVVAAHLQKICHAPQLRQVKIQAVAIQCHLADIGTQAADAHAQHFLINAVFSAFVVLRMMISSRFSLTGHHHPCRNNCEKASPAPAYPTFPPVPPTPRGGEVHPPVLPRPVPARGSFRPHPTERSALQGEPTFQPVLLPAGRAFPPQSAPPPAADARWLVHSQQS